MSHRPELETSSQFLVRLGQQPIDQEAWSEFVARYGRLIHGWCRRWGLQAADAEDVTQNVLVDLARQMRRFEYDPTHRFRGWLRTISYRSWCRFVEARRLGILGWNRPELERVCSPAAGEDLLRQIEEESDRELLERAMERVRRRVRPRTWEAFRLTAIEERSGAEVAALLGMKIPTVFVARSKVQRMLREEVQRLGGGRT
jgi:RNA polymerase sigma factor (sigma-70 family)